MVDGPVRTVQGSKPLTITRAWRLKSRIVSNPWAKPLLNRISNARCRAWDLIHGVHTCGNVSLNTLDFQSEHKTDGLEYQSHHPAVTRSGLNLLGVRHEDYAFIDIGCGKGRALLVASEFPFRSIVGLEFAPPLAEIARRNVRNYRRGPQRCRKIEVISGDALNYELAPEPQVLYLYSPFSPSILDQIMQKIEDSVRQFPRDLLVMFSGVLAMRERAVGSRPEYERLRRDRHMDIYRHR